jgi:nitrate/nitrite-specific signal transduction histidine kinase
MSLRRDGGKGFDASHPEPGGHFGLRLMQVRARQTDGIVKVESEQNRETCVMFTWMKEAEE